MQTILSEIESLRLILENRLSISRFGDGEFCIMAGKRIRFQKRNRDLALLLKNALMESSLPHYVVGLPPLISGPESELPNLWRAAIDTSNVREILNPGQIYHSAFITRPDNAKKFSRLDEECFWKLWSEIVADRDVVLVQSSDISDNQARFLVNSFSISFIKGPSEHAFEEYVRLKTATEECKPKSLFLISLGPTATALCHHLAILGRQAIDIGHLWNFVDKSFDIV